MQGEMEPESSNEDSEAPLQQATTSKGLNLLTLCCCHSSTIDVTADARALADVRDDLARYSSSIDGVRELSQRQIHEVRDLTDKASTIGKRCVAKS